MVRKVDELGDAAEKQVTLLRANLGKHARLGLTHVHAFLSLVEGSIIFSELNKVSQSARIYCVLSIEFNVSCTNLCPDLT